MNQITQIRIDKANFLDWVERQGGKRYELVKGRVVEVPGGSFLHGRLANRLGRLLDERLDGTVWATVSGDFAIDTEPHSYRFPEVSVMRVPADGKIRSTADPVVLMEVASPSTERTDFTDKKDEYLAMPSLVTYVIVSQDERRLWVWAKVAGASPEEPVELAADRDVLAIPAIGFQCTVGENYDRIL